MKEDEADDADRLSNEILVSGAVLALLTSSAAIDTAEVEILPYEETGLLISLPFMKSKYRLTVKMEPDTEGWQPAFRPAYTEEDF